MSAARSRNMAAIGPKDTAPELLVRRFLHSQGFRFRLHRKDLPGRPDIVLPKYRAVVMVNGCFWHHHGCKNSVWPRTRKEFWRAKIEATVDRDRRTVRMLRALGWRVIVVWECEASELRGLLRAARQVRGQVFPPSKVGSITGAARSVRSLQWPSNLVMKLRTL